MSTSPSGTSSTSSIRPGLGIVALIGIAASAWAFWGAGDATLAGLLLRIAIILAALWLAHPVLVSRSRTAWIVTGLGVLLVLIRPRATFVVIPALAVWLVVNARSAE